MEYVAIEEVLSTDLVTRGLGEEPFRILDTGNAMLILLRELRHLQLHLVNTILEGTRKSAVLRTKNRDKEIEPQLTVLTPAQICARWRHFEMLPASIRTSLMQQSHGSHELKRSGVSGMSY
jgi:hypothetical protein